MLPSSRSSQWSHYRQHNSAALQLHARLMLCCSGRSHQHTATATFQQQPIVQQIITGASCARSPCMRFMLLACCMESPQNFCCCALQTLAARALAVQQPSHQQPSPRPQRQLSPRPPPATARALTQMPALSRVRQPTFSSWQTSVLASRVRA